MKMKTGLLGIAVAVVEVVLLLTGTMTAATAAKGSVNVTVVSSPDLVAAENEYLRIEFSRKDGVIRLARLVNKSDQRAVLEDAGPLWRGDRQGELRRRRAGQGREPGCQGTARW